VIALSSVNAGPIYLLAVIAVLALLVAWVAYLETRGDTWVVTPFDEDDQ
jgi:hypothetical protein